MVPTVSGTIADWIADPPRIAGMGFNAIHLLPVTALDDSQSPYAAADLFDIDHSYRMTGSGKPGLAKLEEFIEAAKLLGLRICFDLVLNHVGVDSTMVRRAPIGSCPIRISPTASAGHDTGRIRAGAIGMTWS